MLSSVSPLSGDQQAKMKAELHADPSMGHAKKGSAALKRPRAKKRDVQSHMFSRRKGGNDARR
jgi:hypothetical protein